MYRSAAEMEVAEDPTVVRQLSGELNRIRISLNSGADDGSGRPYLSTGQERTMSSYKWIEGHPETLFSPLDGKWVQRWNYFVVDGDGQRVWRLFPLRPFFPNEVSKRAACPRFDFGE